MLAIKTSDNAQKHSWVPPPRHDIVSILRRGWVVVRIYSDTVIVAD